LLLLGHLRGGPAKAAVVASAMSGLYSGSSIANTVTTGTFTIPLMKRTGFTPEKAGAVEVASSTNGQLTPPVMGAAAFLIAEFTGLPYTDIIKHAAVPAFISYIALVYIVHLEALKLGLERFTKAALDLHFDAALSGVLFGFLGHVCSWRGCLLWSWLDQSCLSGYDILDCRCCFSGVLSDFVYIAARRPDLEIDDPNSPLERLCRKLV
jgi:TRAP-type uncharacterized transport system fused permease subunit